jgi:CDP-paratose 2-epimerase
MSGLRSIRRFGRVAEPIVIFGGAGFIGTNLAHQLLSEGEDVVVFDNLSRPGVERNLAFLRRRNGERLRAVVADIRDAGAVDESVKNAKAVFHFAAQVAVTSSLSDPMQDFAVNAQGTLTVLESLRRLSRGTPLIFASTNKVYGALNDLHMEELEDRYQPIDHAIRDFGVDEGRSLDFCTPYGCSKGAADQYVLDYAHSFGLKTAVLRMSCIYGPHQFGTEDQGWVAHFLIRAMRREAVTVYGNGKQVRAIDRVSGHVFNLGGGPANAVSLREVVDEIAVITGRDVRCYRQPWRTGDQFYFVADTRRLTEAVHWRAKVGWRDGLRDLAGWIGSELVPPEVEEMMQKQRARA